MTNTTTAPFSKLIGQENIKSRLKFSLEVHKAGRQFPFFLFVGAHGNGKTAFIRELAKSTYDGQTRRKYFEINAANIKNVAWFVKNVYLPHIKDREVTVLIDESQDLPKGVQTWFLTLLNTEKSPLRRVVFDNSELEFDFLRQSIFFATTDSNRLLKPLKNRMETLGMAAYSKEELAEIIKLNVPDVDFQDNVLAEAIESLKPSPRAAELMARKISDFCAIKGRKEFDSADFVNLSRMADIKIHGLDNVEIQILKILDERGDMTLNELSACLCIAPTALRQDHEHHLLKKGFLRIDGKRMLSSKGREVAKSFK